VAYTYDTVGTAFKVDPSLLYEDATTRVVTYAKIIRDTIGDIVTTFDSQKLGWIGKTADEVADFQNRWSTVMTMFFGNPDNGTPGVLDKVAGAAAFAAMNFGSAEDVLVSMWTQMCDALAGGGGGSQAVPTDVPTDPVTEVFPG
jgi:hypothetical protein